MIKFRGLGCFFCLCLLVVFCGQTVSLEAKEPIRIATLKFGTVNWVLETIKKRNLDKKHQISLKIVPLASSNGAKIALQGGSADMAVVDWAWVSRRRAEGADFTLVPYSSAVGHVMVPTNSSIKSLADLQGKTIGVPGGPLDKSWLFLRAYAQRELGIDLVQNVKPVYGAPPLLSQKMMRGEFDAVLTFWHYSARLKANGFRSLLSVGDVMINLGTSGPTAAIGFAFSQKWASKNETKVKAFLSAMREAIALLDKDKAVWRDIRPLMKVPDDNSFFVLKKAFIDGILRRPSIVEQADVARLYEVLAALGGKKLLGRAQKLSPGTFWLTGDISQPVPLEEVN